MRAKMQHDKLQKSKRFMVEKAFTDNYPGTNLILRPKDDPGEGPIDLGVLNWLSAYDLLREGDEIELTCRVVSREVVRRVKT